MQLAFVTSPKVDAYDPFAKCSWNEFVKRMKKQASCWAHVACKQVRNQGGYRYPAIGIFDEQRYAVFVPQGDPVFAAEDQMEIVRLDWPQEWNVT